MSFNESNIHQLYDLLRRISASSSSDVDTQRATFRSLSSLLNEGVASDNTTPGRFTELADTPSSLAALMNQVLIVNAAGTAIEATNLVIDEDDMVSNSNTRVPTQQSVKAFVEAETPSGTKQQILNGLDNIHRQFNSQDLNSGIRELIKKFAHITWNATTVYGSIAQGAAATTIEYVSRRGIVYQAQVAAVPVNTDPATDNGVNWRPVLSITRNYYQNRRPASIPATLANPTIVTSPVNGDFVYQEYVDGSVSSIYQSNAWINAGNRYVRVIKVADTAARLALTDLRSGDEVIQNNDASQFLFDGTTLVPRALSYKPYYKSASPFQLINTQIPIVGSLSNVVNLELGETFRYTIYGNKPSSTIDNVTWNMQVLRNGNLLHNITIPNTRLGANQFCWTIDIINTSTVQTSVVSLINSTTPVWNGGEKTYYRFDLAGKNAGATDQFELKMAPGTPGGVSLFIINVIQEVIKL